ncbi:MAG: ABC transporter permease [Firmicutes bacterium]|nr:ABC transporter permease [Bacillota bacterium]
MTNLPILLRGEIQRMKKYNILTGGFAVALLWVAALHFLDRGFVEGLFTTLLFVDLVSMPAILAAVSLFYEREEGALHAMLVAPISHREYVLSKMLGNVFSSLLTLVLMYLYVRLFKGMSPNVPILVMAAVLASAFHTLVGLLLTYKSRDFTGMLMGYMVYALVFMIPVMLDHVGVVSNKFFRIILSLCPPRAVSVLLDSAVVELQWGEILYGFLYLTVVGGLLFRTAVEGFSQFAQREVGV